MAEPGVQPDAAASDARALAGTYAGLLPCADCPGIDETLVLDADGGYVLTDTYRESDGAAHVVQGTWSIEPDGKRIRLDPGNKGDADRFFAIEADALVNLDTDGKPIDSPFDMRLVRER
ncbi:MAG: copper resistance protein NlpE [Pseudomonadota bacterium]|nr:copper resistance protein NlpE [Pseudomonadota bacterium]